MIKTEFAYVIVYERPAYTNGRGQKISAHSCVFKHTCASNRRSAWWIFNGKVHPTKEEKATYRREYCRCVRVELRWPV